MAERLERRTHDPRIVSSILLWIIFSIFLFFFLHENYALHSFFLFEKLICVLFDSLNIEKKIVNQLF